MTAARENGVRYFTMDFIEGMTLADYWRKRSLDFINIAKLMSKIATAIHYVHSQDIIHRDLKPANIMIDRNDEPTIIDFGIAKFGQLPSNDYKKLSQTGETLGTIHYMAPEQAEGDSDLVDRRSDVYSLGTILYEILTGRPVFASDSQWNILYKIAHEQPVGAAGAQPGNSADVAKKFV